MAALGGSKLDPRTLTWLSVIVVVHALASSLRSDCTKTVIGLSMVHLVEIRSRLGRAMRLSGGQVSFWMNMRTQRWWVDFNVWE